MTRRPAVARASTLGAAKPAPAEAKAAAVDIPRFAAERKPAPRKPKAAATPLSAVPSTTAQPVKPAIAVAPPAPSPRPTARLAPAGALPPAYIPPEALATPSHNRLVTIAIAASLLVHGLILAMHFSMPDVTPKSSDAPIEVALVNAKTKAAPTKADILAQANLDGGGNTDQNRRAKSPLPVLPKDTPRNEITVATERVEALEQQTKELLTQLRSSPVAAPRPAPTDQQEPTESPTANEMMQKTLEAMRLEAQIAKDMDAYQKRPKRQFVGSRAQEYRFARYVEDWRLKIERVGNLNYPAAARDQKLYGSLILTVGIRADGTVESIEVNRPSGHRILDAAAQKIVTMSGPFAAFPPDIRRDTDILYITRTWTFTKSDALVSQ
ncbi:MAG TPA: TonB family protein [Casimicrobiaceae bacterium]|nr:TonB family protein [Casimicrobiaceae bacterium]